MEPDDWVSDTPDDPNDPIPYHLTLEGVLRG